MAWLHYCVQRTHRILVTVLCIPGVLNARPAGSMQPSDEVCAARVHFSDTCCLDILDKK
jgi:hypothetical protein